MNRIINLILFLFGLFALSLLQSCGPDSGEAYKIQAGQEEGEAHKIPQYSQEERDYIERFNATVKDIRDFPPQGKDIEKYFHVFKSVAQLEDAEIIFFGEVHNHALNHIWSAGAINRMMRPQDVVLFEGNQAGTKVENLSERFGTQIFAAREYEKLKAHKAYKPTGVSEMKDKYWQLFFKTEQALALDALKLSQGSGFYWDLLDGEDLHDDIALRNESMVQTIKGKLGSNRVFVIAGALHLPHYEFAKFMKFERKFPILFADFLAQPGADKTKINDAFFDYYDGTGGKGRATTKSIFDFLKGKKFAVLIPKNLPGFAKLKSYFPTNAE